MVASPGAAWTVTALSGVGVVRIGIKAPPTVLLGSVKKLNWGEFAFSGAAVNVIGPIIVAGLPGSGASAVST